MRRIPWTSILTGLALVVIGSGLVAKGKVTIVTGPAQSLTQPYPVPAIPPGALVRFHVIANSDDPSDQAVKLQVRDAVLPRVYALGAASSSPAAALRAVEAGRQEILTAARRALAAAGRPDEPVRLEVGAFEFPATRYPGFDLPAGRYPAVRLVLGAGRGHNWWCVMFPMLCYPEWAGQIETGPADPAWPPDPGAPEGRGTGPLAAPARALAHGATPVLNAGAAPALATGTTPAPGPAPSPGSGTGTVVILDERTVGELPVVPRLAFLRWLEGLRASPRLAPPGQIAAAGETWPSTGPHRP